MRKSTVVAAVLAFILGRLTGGYLFSDTRPRSFLAINRCESCLAPAELAGLLASVGIQEGRDFLVDAYGVAGELVRKEKLFRYRILTNGPGYQDVNYLHFHLIGS